MKQNKKGLAVGEEFRLPLVKAHPVASTLVAALQNPGSTKLKEIACCALQNLLIDPDVQVLSPSPTLHTLIPHPHQQHVWLIAVVIYIFVVHKLQTDKCQQGNHPNDLKCYGVAACGAKTPADQRRCEPCECNA